MYLHAPSNFEEEIRVCKSLLKTPVMGESVAIEERRKNKNLLKPLRMTLLVN